jgi:hypothetical protein
LASKVPTSPRRAPKGAAAPRAVEGHNSEAVEEADRIQLISIISKLSQADEAIELAKVPLIAAQDHRKTIIGLGKAAGWSAGELKARLEEMKTPTREMAEKAAREHKHRRWLGILDADQSKLMLGNESPQEAKDEAHHAGEGYKAGLRQLPSTPPTEVPERFVQAYMHAHERGLKEVLAANVPGGQRLREKAAADFAKDEPDVDLDKAARDLKKTAFMERTPVPEIVDQDPLGVNDGFEATLEELALQAGRPDHAEVV